MFCFRNCRAYTGGVDSETFMPLVDIISMDTFNDNGRPQCSCSNQQHSKRVLKDGRTIFGMHCMNCGRWTPKSKSAFDKLPTIFFDETIRVQFQKRLENFHRSKSEKNRSEWFAAYSTYLSSQKWKEKRIAVLERDNYLCQGCRNQKASQVHHLSYKNVGNEFLSELISLCSECHSKLHPHM